MRKSMENSKLLAFFHALPHCLFQEQVPLFQEQVTSHCPCSPSLLVPGTSNLTFSIFYLTACSRNKYLCIFHGLPHCLFQEQINLFQEQVTSLFPCSPSLLIPGANKLVPGTSYFTVSMLSLIACSRNK